MVSGQFYMKGSAGWSNDVQAVEVQVVRRSGSPRRNRARGPLLLLRQARHSRLERRSRQVYYYDNFSATSLGP